MLTDAGRDWQRLTNAHTRADFVASYLHRFPLDRTSSRIQAFHAARHLSATEIKLDKNAKNMKQCVLGASHPFSSALALASLKDLKVFPSE